MGDYLTDGVHLYEVVRRTGNYGLTGGVLLLVVDCATETTRELSPLESSLCKPVIPVTEPDSPR